MPAPFMTLAPTAAAEPGDAGELTSDICSESFILRPTPVRFVIGAAAGECEPCAWGPGGGWRARRVRPARVRKLLSLARRPKN